MVSLGSRTDTICDHDAILTAAVELIGASHMVSGSGDALYRYSADSQKEVVAKKPWVKDPNYFQTVRISSVALVKMVTHARSGGSLEVMGLMQGYVDGSALVVTDAFRLPVEGTETRVNAQDEANEYMVEYLQLCREQGRLENAVGWYHSHPGYGCWLSGIDVNTQALQQQFSDPFVAVVIDPDRTISASKVDIGAFRTYPENYKHQDGNGTDADGYQMVPFNKVDDFGAHASRYYSLDVEHFKSTLDARLLQLLWNKYWVQTLSQSHLVTNREYGQKQMRDLGHKVRELATGVQRAGRSPSTSALGSGPLIFGGQMGASKGVDLVLDKLGRDSRQLASDEQSGLAASQVKANTFGATISRPSDRR
jgi:COP9 signalosome complex subunit 5